MFQMPFFDAFSLSSHAATCHTLILLYAALRYSFLIFRHADAAADTAAAIFALMPLFLSSSPYIRAFRFRYFLCTHAAL